MPITPKTGSLFHAETQFLRLHILIVLFFIVAGIGFRDASLHFNQLALAQEASISSARLLWYGVYQFGSNSVVEDKTAATGIRIISAGIASPKINSDRIPAILGLQFGFGYELEGYPVGGIARVKHVHFYPVKRLTNPKTGEKYFTEQHEYNYRIDRKDLSVGNVFTENFELVPGVWIFEVWHGNRKLLEKSFTVYAP